MSSFCIVKSNLFRVHLKWSLYLCCMTVYSYFKKRYRKKSKKPLSQGRKVIWDFYNNCTDKGHFMYVPEWNFIWENFKTLELWKQTCLEGLQTEGPVGNLRKYNGGRNDNGKINHIKLIALICGPTNEDICSSVIITWSVCYSACAKILCFTITNKQGRSTEANVMSSTAFCGRILSAPRKKDGESGTKTQKQTGICMLLRLLKWIRRENS